MKITSLDVGLVVTLVATIAMSFYEFGTSKTLVLCGFLFVSLQFSFGLLVENLNELKKLNNKIKDEK